MRGVSARWKPRAVTLLGAIATVGLLAQQPQPHPAQLPAAHSAATPAHVSAAKPANSYVDAALCGACHAEIARAYAKTGMGRSFTKVGPKSPTDPFPDMPFFHAASDSYFSMVVREGKTYQRRWQLGFDGKETNVEEKSVEYILGSGNHGRAYLHLTPRNGLQELPLGWYSEDGEIYLDRFFGDAKQQLPPNWYSGTGGGIWAMNPGFDRAEIPGSERAVGYECMFCHNGYPKIPKASEEAGAESVYQLPLPGGIDCQRCHGPGQRHIDVVGKPGVTPEEIRASVVNPKRLSSDREMEVCLQCHLETTSLKLPHSTRRADRTPFSYIPGEPLEAFVLSFDREPGQNVRLEGAGAAYRLRKSQCFIRTQANDAEHQLRCTSCHDPHEMPRRGATASPAERDAATSHYNGVCATCHTAAFAAKVSAGTHPANPDCIGCHMPKRRTDDAVHIVMTEHFIQRVQPTNLLDKKPEHYESASTSYRGDVVPYYPAKLAPTPKNMLDVAVAQVRDGSNYTNGIPQLLSLIQKYKPTQPDYYVDLAEAFHAVGDLTHAAQYFDEALRRAPNSTVIMLKLANAQLEWQTWPRAEATTRRVIAKTPDDPVAWGLLGEALFQQGKEAEAKEALNKALALEPDMPEPHNYLAAMLVRAGDLTGAEREFRAALEIQPTNAEWQANLAGLVATRGGMPEARFLFERAIRLKPDSVSARINYAKLLANMNLTADAEQQAKAAVLADPGVPAAHELWGVLLTAQGDADGAARELKTAVNLQPDFWRAQYELGVALRTQGDAQGATAHLRLAAQGNDPQAKAAALQVLQQSGQ